MANVEQTMMKVQRILTGPMGLRLNLVGDRINVRFDGSSTSVDLRVQEWTKDRDGEPRSLVLITALILRDVKPTPELFEWVARQGGSRWFGHVEVHNDGDGGNVYLLMSHTLLGDYLDEHELGTGLYSILSAADAWDDELQKQFGGKKWSDS